MSSLSLFGFQFCICARGRSEGDNTNIIPIAKLREFLQKKRLVCRNRTSDHLINAIYHKQLQSNALPTELRRAFATVKQKNKNIKSVVKKQKCRKYLGKTKCHKK